MDAALAAAGAPYKFVRYENEGHIFITGECIKQCRDYIASFGE